MSGNPIVIKMIESTIDKTIRDLKNHPERGLQSLIDLANRFASSPLQKEMATSLEAMLASPNNPYYDLIPSMVNHINHHTMKTFITNMAYRSWSYGAKKIKQYKKSYNYSIPWTIIFDFSEDTGGKLSKDTLIRTITHGKKIGIYTYMFFIDDINYISDVLEHNLDCAFIVYTAPTSISKANIPKIKSYPHTLFSVLYQADGSIEAFQSATKLLLNHQCLFGSHSYYSDKNIQYILSNQWLSDLTKAQSPFGFLIESHQCSQENATLIHNYMDQSKTNPQYPIFLIDFYPDMANINKQLSSHPCVFKILGNGDIHCPLLNPLDNFNIHQMNLFEIISTLNS